VTWTEVVHRVPSDARALLHAADGAVHKHTSEVEARGASFQRNIAAF